MSHQVEYFGVGCLIFGLQESGPSKILGSDYLEELNSFLESNSNIDSINLRAGDDFLEDEFEFDEMPPSIREGTYYFPPPDSDLTIQFDVIIPHRIQKELSVLNREKIRCGERFRVTTYYSFDSPYTVVLPLEPGRRCAPSSAVVVVREFLETQLSKDESSFIQYDWLGPSPFHADFEIIPVEDEAEELDDALVAEFIQRRGYDLVQFRYDTNYFEDSSQAATYAVFKLEDELGLFYRSVHSRHREMRAWMDVSEAFNDLVDMHEARGLRSTIRRFLRSSRRIQDVVFDLTQFERISLNNQAAYNRAYRNIGGGRVSLYLDDRLSREVTDRSEYPVAQVRELVNLIESRRAKSFDNLIILVAAVIGGAIGAFITLLLT